MSDSFKDFQARVNARLSAEADQLKKQWAENTGMSEDSFYVVAAAVPAKNGKFDFLFYVLPINYGLAPSPGAGVAAPAKQEEAKAKIIDVTPTKVGDKPETD